MFSIDLEEVVVATEVHGEVEPGFEGVREAFARNFERDDARDVGAAFCLYVEGRSVVDLWGGTRHSTDGQAASLPYDGETLQLLYSATKAATATCANLLLDRGLLDLDAPVASYWPEFAQGGKERVTVRWLLTHRAGVAAVDRPLSLEDVLTSKPVVEALEVQAPTWEPGTAHGYHGMTYGWLVGELVRRVDGRSIGEFFRDEVAAPLQLDFWIGLPPEQEHRVAALLAPELDPAVRAAAKAYLASDSWRVRAVTLNGVFPDPSDPALFNRPDVHAAEIASANGITNARSLARLYAGLIGTVEHGPPAPLLRPEQVERARQVETSGPDQVLSPDPETMPVESTFGLGFMRSSATFARFGGTGAFGHFGNGGPLGFADPDHAIGFGYVGNQMVQSFLGDARTRALVQAAYDAIGVDAPFA